MIAERAATGDVDVTWDGHAATALAEQCGVPRVELLAATDSTMDVAHALAERGAPAGTVVLADVQRAGRGRMGRAWASPAGQGVWCTVIERPARADVLEALSLRVGMYAADALDPFAPQRLGLKWPNDLLLGTRKLGGILVEARWQGGGGDGAAGMPQWIAIGVGVNVIAPDAVPDAVGLRAGSARVDVFRAVVGAVRAAAAVGGPLGEAELARYAARDVLAGQRIVAPAAGVVRGIAPSGALIVETSHGTEEHRAGTIRMAEAT